MNESLFDITKQSLQIALDSFIKWLQPFFESNLGTLSISALFSAYEYASITYIRALPPIIIESDEFRYMFEYCINTRLNDDYERMGDGDISNLSKEELEAQIEVCEKYLREVSMPNNPDYNRYHSLQEWATKMEDYYQCDNIENQKETFQEQLEIINRAFNPETHVLYIYAGTVECLTQHSSSCF